jgi:hypothetical protein
MSPSKYVIVAPFWKQAGHVGNYRVDRFIRWLSERGDHVILVRAGDLDRTAQTPWGVEITVCDPFGLYRGPCTSGGPPPRQPNRFRRSLSYVIFNPDPTIVWAHRAAVHPSVLQLARGARWVISSSPPESAHVAAARLASRIGSDLLVDMRDGWLDEPLKPLLRASGVQRWREGRLERRTLDQSRCVLVTSAGWKKLLTARLPHLTSKITVLTNAYPPAAPPSVKPASATAEGLTLVHSGRLSGSRQSQQVGVLLDPLLAGVKAGTRPKGTILFLGSLSRQDLDALTGYQHRFQEWGWQIMTQAAVPRDEMLNRLAVSDGLLLLSASNAAIPSKTFEYIVTRKPVLAVCPEESSVWQMTRDLPQFFPVACGSDAQGAKDAVNGFLAACSAGCSQVEVPPEYAEEHLKTIFLAQLSTGSTLADAGACGHVRSHMASVGS